VKKLAKNSLILCVLKLLAGCDSVTIPNVTYCTVAGRLRAGAICAESLTSRTYDMTFEETVKFLEPRGPLRGMPARAGAICQSTSDFVKTKNALDQLCILAKKKCTMEARAALYNMDKQVGSLK